MSGIPSTSVTLGATWFAAELPPASLESLSAIGRLISIPRGTTVVREGVATETLGVVVEGRIALRLALPGGEDRTIMTIDPGDVYGWSAVLPPAIATSTGIAIAPSRAIVFDGETLRSLLATDCDLGAAVYRRLLATVARRLVATRLQLLDVYRSGLEPW